MNAAPAKLAASVASKPRARLEHAIACLVIAAALLLIYYRGASRLGLYEDDYVSVAKAMDIPWSAVWAQLRGWAVDWPGGRPLGNAGALVIPFFLSRAGGMTALYLLPFTALLLNSTLVYFIVRRRAGFFAGFVAGLVYALLPTDTLRLSLHATPELQFAILYLLLGILAYESRHWWLCYPCLVLSMLCHESATLPFVAIPLLGLGTRRVSWRGLLAHSGACSAAVGLVLATRGLIIHEVRTRAIMSDPAWIVQRMLVSFATGTVTHLKLLLIRPVEALRAINPGWLAMIVLIGAAVIGAYLYATREDDTDAEPNRGRFGLSFAGLATAGALFFALPYLAYITDPYWPANHMAGRIASVHTASGLGVALLAGAVAAAIQRLLPVRSTVQRFAVEVLAVYIAFLLGWGHVVEQQYRQAWANEQRFWSALVPQVGDIQNHTLIFIESLPDGFPSTWAIGSNSWADSIMLRTLYRFPYFEREPRAFFVTSGWQTHTRLRDGRVQWFMPVGEWQPAWVDLEPYNVILIRAVDGRPERVGGVLHVAAGDVPLKPVPPHPAEPPFPHRALYPYMIANRGS